MSTSLVDLDTDSANSNINVAIRQWREALDQELAAHFQLQKLLDTMLKDMKDGNTQEAFQIATFQVMPQTMKVQGDELGVVGATMNIESACQTDTTNAQNNITSNGNMTQKQAAEFVKEIKQFYNEVKAELNPAPGGKSWMSSSTAESLLSAMDQISKSFGAKNPDELNPNTVMFTFNFWVQNPNATSSNGKTGQQNLQNLQTSFSNWNNIETAQSQGTQTYEQFKANTFNQYMNTCKNFYQSLTRQFQSFVQNEKA